jgi:hypothetical protein
MKLVDFLELIGTAGILQLVLWQFYKYINIRDKCLIENLDSQNLLKATFPSEESTLSNLVVETSAPEPSNGVLKVIQNTNSDRELASPKHILFHFRLDFGYLEYSFLKLASVYAFNTLDPSPLCGQIVQIGPFSS